MRSGIYLSDDNIKDAYLSVLDRLLQIDGMFTFEASQLAAAANEFCHYFSEAIQRTMGRYNGFPARCEWIDDELDEEYVYKELLAEFLSLKCGQLGTGADFLDDADIWGEGLAVWRQKIVKVVVPYSAIVPYGVSITGEALSPWMDKDCSYARFIEEWRRNYIEPYFANQLAFALCGENRSFYHTINHDFCTDPENYDRDVQARVLSEKMVQCYYEHYSESDRAHVDHACLSLACFACDELVEPSASDRASWM